MADLPADAGRRFLLCLRDVQAGISAQGRKPPPAPSETSAGEARLEQAEHIAVRQKYREIGTSFFAAAEIVALRYRGKIFLVKFFKKLVEFSATG